MLVISGITDEGWQNWFTPKITQINGWFWMDTSLLETPLWSLCIFTVFSPGFGDPPRQSRWRTWVLQRWTDCIYSIVIHDHVRQDMIAIMVPIDTLSTWSMVTVSYLRKVHFACYALCRCFATQWLDFANLICNLFYEMKELRNILIEQVSSALA